MTRDAEIVVLPDPEAVAQEAAQRFVALANQAVKARGRFGVALCGGSTPEGLYRLLAEERYQIQVPWSQCHLFWGDERCVGPDGAGSNYRMANEAWIQHVPIPAENVHRIHGELEPEAAAQAYARTLVDFFCGPRPRFDLVLLGLGEDGHIASLFPGAAVLQEAERLVVAVEARYQNRPASRVTLTLPAINSARQILFLVVGSAKAGIVREAIRHGGADLPAQAVRPVAGGLTWLVDAAAASLLGSQTVNREA